MILPCLFSNKVLHRIEDPRRMTVRRNIRHQRLHLRQRILHRRRVTRQTQHLQIVLVVANRQHIRHRDVQPPRQFRNARRFRAAGMYNFDCLVAVSRVAVLVAETPDEVLHIVDFIPGLSLSMTQIFSICFPS